MLAAREALLLRRRDDLAVAEEGGRRIMVEGRNAENVRHAAIRDVARILLRWSAKRSDRATIVSTGFA